MEQKDQKEHDYQAYLYWTYFGKNAFDSAEFAKFDETLKGVIRFIDVGSSHGVYTYHANRVLENAEIFAIEADPERFSILQENAMKWSTESTNTIHCINAAASDEEDRKDSAEITFFTTGTQVSGGLFSVSERSNEYAPIPIKLVCVDDYFDHRAKTFVKIDVEGSELRVLKGATRHIENGNTQFFTEISWWGDRDRGTNAFDVLRFCMKSGLRVERRLHSDYLISPEPNSILRLWSTIRCLPPLMLRVGYNKIVPLSIRTRRERRLLSHRLSRFNNAE